MFKTSLGKVMLAAVLTVVALGGCVGEDEPEDQVEERQTEADDGWAGSPEKAYCPHCVTACKTDCDHKAQPFCPDFSLSACYGSCSTTVTSLETACVDEYLAYYACVNGQAAPQYVCSADASRKTTPTYGWNCLSQKNALTVCRQLN